MSPNKDAEVSEEGSRGRTGGPGLPEQSGGTQGHSGSPGPSTRKARRAGIPAEAAREGSRGPGTTGPPSDRPADGKNPTRRLASPATITGGSARATRDASRDPGKKGSPSSRPREGDDGQPRLGSPAAIDRDRAGADKRTSPASRTSSTSATRNSPQTSEAGHKSETSSGSPGSGTHGKPPSKASSRGSPGSDKTANSADSSESGEAFIRRITGQAFNAGSSNPPTDFVLCIDGTGNDMLNEEEVKNTNIAKITQVIDYGKHGDRITTVAYQQGLGNQGKKYLKPPNDGGESEGWTKELNLSFNKLWPSGSTLNKLMPTEATIARLVSINYAYISMCVCPNKDRLFLFGFSRGAYISQITAALVADLGIVSNQKYVEKFSDVEHSKIIGRIVETWIKNRGSAATIKKELEAYSECLIPAKIQFLGLFDMVASVGKPDLGKKKLQSTKFVFAETVHNRSNILNAYHAVAISEHRNQFKPVLWTDGADNLDRKISQVWFPGYHTSIGGGTKTQGIMIYYITLVWMLSKCTGLVFDKQEIEKLILIDAGRASAMIGKQIPDSKKGMWAAPGAGEHVRTELGKASIDMVHRVCDEVTWGMSCAPKLPLDEGAKKRVEPMLEAKRVDKMNKFEFDLRQFMIKEGPGEKLEEGSSSKKAGKDVTVVLES